MPLDYHEKKVVEHLKEHRPTMHQELKNSGRLEATAKQMWADYTDQMHNLEVVQKLPHNQALELAWDTAYPPSEKDQPHLGENPASADPTTAMTTRSPKAIASAKAPSPLKRKLT